MAVVALLGHSSIDITFQNRPIDSNGNLAAMFAICKQDLMWMFCIHADEIDRLSIAADSRFIAYF